MKPFVELNNLLCLPDILIAVKLDVHQFIIGYWSFYIFTVFNYFRLRLIALVRIMERKIFSVKKRPADADTQNPKIPKSKKRTPRGIVILLDLLRRMVLRDMAPPDFWRL